MCRLDSEQPLDFVPNCEAEQRQHPGQQDERGPEPEVRVLSLALTAGAGAPLRALKPVRPRDGRRIDGWRGVPPPLTACRLGHDPAV